mmetsp:Transcript_43629/g.114671  ORF Transcript_43629/g.114671 Transcript_43629/m.114671 type:complete len:126 (+) Transcript_43629:138-515(+)
MCATVTPALSLRCLLRCSPSAEMARGVVRVARAPPDWLSSWLFVESSPFSVCKITWRSPRQHMMMMLIMHVMMMHIMIRSRCQSHMHPSGSAARTHALQGEPSLSNVCWRAATSVGAQLFAVAVT